MKAIIVGAGEVGFHIAKRLASESKDVVVIDRNPIVLQRILEHMDVQVLEGSGCSPLILGEAGITNADMLLAVTDSDEINIMACTFANMLAPGLTKLARIRNDEYMAYGEQLAREIGINMIINPDVEVVRTIEHMLSAPGAIDISDLAKGRIKLAGTWITAGNPLIGMKLMEMRKKVPRMAVIVAAIVRNEKLIVPTGADMILEGDLVYFVCEDISLQSVFSFLGNRPTKQNSVLIIGGGKIGLRLARALERKHIQVKLLDKNSERCAELAGQLNRTLVLNGDGTDQEVLLEENVGDMDVVMTMTGNEESNILASLLAKKLGTPMAITRLNKIEYMPLVRAIGLEHIVSPRLSAVNSIFKHVRKGGVLSAVAIKEGAEAIEVLIDGDSRMVGTAVKDISFPRGVLVLCIMREDSVIIPGGHDVIMSGDRLIILSVADSISEVEGMLSQSREHA